MSPTVIEVKDICKTYFMAGGTSQSVLKHVNFTIHSGEFVAIMGHSGSGKSTLMNILGCLDRPTSGEYLLEGQNVANLSDADMAKIRGKRIGFVFQNFNLLMKRTIADNVSLPLIYQGVGEKERYERAVQMLQKVQLEGYQDRLPTQISGGMQQRVAIARAVVCDPKIILADEPTGNLDSETTEQIMNVFKEISASGTAVVITTHNMSLLEKYPGTVYQCEGNKMTKQ
jgi:putative ABC transport system ATP-binding protein